MKKINFIYEYEQDGVIFPNGLTKEAYNSTLEQIELHNVSTYDFFVTKKLTDHHNVINLSSRYPDKTFNIFYTRTINENILENVTKINDKKYSFEKDNNEYEIELVQFNNLKKGENNYYIINLFGNESFLFQYPSITVTNLEEKQTNNNNIFNFNPAIIEQIKNKNLKLIICTFHEGGVHYNSFLEAIYTSCKLLELNPNDISYVNADANINLHHTAYCETHNINNKINTYFVDYLFSDACNQYSNNDYDVDVLNYEGEREKNFLIFNRSVFKDHRFWYLSQLQKNGILDNCLFSMIFPYDREIEYGQDTYRGFPTFATEEEFEENKKWMQEIKNMGVVKIDDIDTFEDSTYYANGKRVHYGWIDWVKPTFDPSFLRTYMTLLTESAFTTCQVSEKGVKALRYYHPFIAVAGPYYLRMLREKGFKTFSKYFDESYDEIEDHGERMKAVIKLTNELNDSKKLHKIFMNSKEEVIHNSMLCRKFSSQDSIKTLFNKIFSI
jgi:hypothetical protein